jgi:uncharacterized membrane-anchored protein
MTSNIHPYHQHRDIVLNEIHARPLTIVPAGSRVRRFVLLPDKGQTDVAVLQTAFRQYCLTNGLGNPGAGTRFHTFEHENIAVIWEFHTEFVTVTWHYPLRQQPEPPAPASMDIANHVPLLSAIRVDIIEDAAISPELTATFRPASFCLVNLEGRKGQVATDFVRDMAGFTRFEFASGAIGALRRSVILRRLLEMETYRSVALLGLPLAKEISPHLQVLEDELAQVVPKLGSAIKPDQVDTMLEALHSLSLRSGEIAERLGFRFAASQAYGALLRERLASLKEEPSDQGLSLANFTANRVNPALATFSAMEKRLNVLATKIERAISLLNARIGLDIQMQNHSVLETISRTAKSHFQLQRTVEGLSTVAITYYLIGIAGYALGAPLAALHIDKTIALSVIAPIGLAIVWLAMRRIRRAH